MAAKNVFIILLPSFLLCAFKVLYLCATRRPWDRQQKVDTHGSKYDETPSLRRSQTMMEKEAQIAMMAKREYYRRKSSMTSPEAACAAARKVQGAERPSGLDS